MTREEELTRLVLSAFRLETKILAASERGDSLASWTIDYPAEWTAFRDALSDLKGLRDQLPFRSLMEVIADYEVGKEGAA